MPCPSTHANTLGPPLDPCDNVVTPVTTLTLRIKAAQLVTVSSTLAGSSVSFPYTHTTLARLDSANPPNDVHARPQCWEGGTCWRCQEGREGGLGGGGGRVRVDCNKRVRPLSSRELQSPYTEPLTLQILPPQSTLVLERSSELNSRRHYTALIGRSLFLSRSGKLGLEHFSSPKR